MSQETNPAYCIVIDVEHIPRRHVQAVLNAASQSQDAAPACVWVLHNKDDSAPVQLSLPFTERLHNLPLNWVKLPEAVTTGKDTFSYFAGVFSQCENPNMHLVLVSNRVNSCNSDMFCGDVRHVKTGEQLVEFCAALNYTVELPKKRESSNDGDAAAQAKPVKKAKSSKSAKSKKKDDKE
ncbi:MAG: hypothetical protein K0U52_02130 [Gammaproteobacteria bacterium]|nr:hypothetical protein [Gammaproteobacteria bacterium]